MYQLMLFCFEVGRWYVKTSYCNWGVGIVFLDVFFFSAKLMLSLPFYSFSEARGEECWC